MTKPGNTGHSTVVGTGGNEISILVSSEQTNSEMSMVRVVSTPGTGPTYHSHDREDETFYVVSGTADIWLEDKIYRCTAGDYIFGPRGIPHSFRNAGEDLMTMVIVYNPAGFEQSFLDADAMRKEGKTHDDIGQMLHERYGMTRLPFPTEG